MMIPAGASRPHLCEVGARQAGEVVARVAVVQAHVALDAAHHRQQLAREVLPHVGAEPGDLRICGSPRVGRRLRQKQLQGERATSSSGWVRSCPMQARLSPGHQLPLVADRAPGLAPASLYAHTSTDVQHTVSLLDTSMPVMSLHSPDLHRSAVSSPKAGHLVPRPAARQHLRASLPRPRKRGAGGLAPRQQHELRQRRNEGLLHLLRQVVLQGSPMSALLTASLTVRHLLTLRPCGQVGFLCLMW